MIIHVPKIPVNETLIVQLLSMPTTHVIWSPLFNTDKFANKVDSKEFIGVQLVLVRCTVKPSCETSRLESELQSNVKCRIEAPFLNHSKNVVPSAMHLKWTGLGQIKPLGVTDWLELRVICDCAPKRVVPNCLM